MTQHLTEDRFDLTGQTAVVTGGGRGIGRAIAFGLAEAGADVVPTARTESDLEPVVAGIEARGQKSALVTADVAVAEEIDALFATVEANLGPVDILVNNAGINPSAALGTPERVDQEAWNQVTSVNLGGAFACARAAAPNLVETEGCVVNVASVGGLVGLPRQHPYVASKHGLVGLTKSMAIDWAPGVRVNCVAPGYVATDLTEDLTDDDQLRASIEERTPLDRFATPDEVAAPVVFLASEAAAYITGTTLAVDGGWTAR
jgi:NAD(P)-dependent dehydrogenase (short-subunit alcohol dehydrogenase family)